ncbi:YopX family protein [Niallia taxi]|uniref:YopX family protein n=1 Tax=Niallia taxi TaxID=2499688 RepID=UPI0020420E74|nr:YopX family protein [Niallia taxi]MCM3216139.1 YopX family protein [Niallia taxi]
MREIKFKALVFKTRLDNLGSNMQWAGVSEYEELIPVQTIAFDNSDVDLVTDKEGEEYSFIENNLRMILQYTGLKDKSGVEIYEGDILQNSDGKRFVIKWGINSNGFVAQTNETQGKVYSSYHLSFKTIVIGNIYKNPNLLKGGGKSDW